MTNKKIVLSNFILLKKSEFSFMNFEANGFRKCNACPAGYYCSTTAKVKCSAGTYSLGSQTSCTTCPRGYYCPRIDSLPVICPDGYWSSAGADTCTVSLFILCHRSAQQDTNELINTLKLHAPQLNTH